MKKFIEKLFSPLKNKISKTEKIQAEKEARWENLKEKENKKSGRFSRIGQRIKFALHKHFPKRIWNNAQENRKGRKF